MLLKLPCHAIDKDNRMSIGSTYSAAARQSIVNQGEGLLGTRRPRPHKIWKKKYIKLLVVGDSGVRLNLSHAALPTPPAANLFTTTGPFAGHQCAIAYQACRVLCLPQVWARPP